MTRRLPMTETLEDNLFDTLANIDYYKGFGKYSDYICIHIQIYAQILYWGE
jgi:hypothetical protein